MGVFATWMSAFLSAWVFFFSFSPVRSPVSFDLARHCWYVANEPKECRDPVFLAQGLR
jgi:hypothetical protein